MLDCFKRDKEIIRNAFKTYSKKDLHPSDYEQAVRSLERMHANFFLKYCKAQGYKRQKSRELFYANNMDMLDQLDRAMDIHGFPKDEYA